MLPTRIDINDTIILNDNLDRYEVKAWDFDPGNPDVDTITYEVEYLGQAGPGTTINIDDIIYNDNQPAHEYKVTGWDYSSVNPMVTSITFFVEYQG